MLLVQYIDIIINKFLTIEITTNVNFKYDDNVGNKDIPKWA